MEDKAIEQLKEIALKAGKMMTEVDFSKLHVDEKTSFRDVVTNLDKEIQRFCIEQIKQVVPGAKFFAEEEGMQDDLNSADLFVIDPIDGTTNFIHKYNYSAVSIAWLKGGKSYMGIVYNPFVNEFYFAKSGEGAYLNERRLKVKAHDLKQSLVIFGSTPYDIELRRNTLCRVMHISPLSQDIRRFGSAALDICHVASNEAGLFFESALSFWDYAAAEIILEEAGGVMLDYSGNRVGPAVCGHIDVVKKSGMINFIEKPF